MTDPRDRCFIQTELFENGRGTDDFLNTCAHEVGHALRLNTRSLNHSWTSYNYKQHDPGAFPYFEYYGDGTNVDPAKQVIKPSRDPKVRLIFGLMTQGTPPVHPAQYDWRWIRHEDWEEVNDKAKDFETP